MSDVHQTPISTFLWLIKDEINVGKRDKKKYNMMGTKIVPEFVNRNYKIKDKCQNYVFK